MTRRTVLDLLCKSKINQLEMSLGIDKNILRFQVTVRHAFSLVQEL